MNAKPFLLALLFASLGLLAGCTGDPHTGGIFWSETKAQERIRDRQNRLNGIDDDTDRVRHRNARAESAVERRREMLGDQ